MRRPQELTFDNTGALETYAREQGWNACLEAIEHHQSEGYEAGRRLAHLADDERRTARRKTLNEYTTHEFHLPFEIRLLAHFDGFDRGVAAEVEEAQRLSQLMDRLRVALNNARPTEDAS